MEQKNRVLSFLKTQKLAVISTVTNNTPESALVAFAEDDRLCLYFQTGRHTRKAVNLQQNPKVSFVFGLTLADMITVQYQGLAARITKTRDLKECKQLFAAKDSPTTEKYFNHPTAVFYKVSPTWIGYSDYTEDTPEVLEISI